MTAEEKLRKQVKELRKMVRILLNDGGCDKRYKYV